MFAEMSQTRFEQFHMIVALGKRFGISRELIPQFANEDSE